MSKSKKLTSDGIQYHGEEFIGEDDVNQSFSYSFGDLGDMGQLNLFSEENMRDKYPALKQAWEHYQSVLEVCNTKEQEDED